MTIKELSDKLKKLDMLNDNLESIRRELNVCNQFREDLLNDELLKLKNKMEALENEDI
jgi:predicted nuclease with TOPRIM domain